MQEGDSGVARAGGAVGVFLSLAGLTAGLTLVYLGMRAVMKIGGFCAEGGPYVIQHQCPKGVAAVMIGGIWGGIIAAGVYVWLTIKHKVPTLIWLAWPALFLSLGWNFLQFGISPPGSGGLAWGWLVCAVLFILMGGVPLVIAAPFFVRKLLRPAEPTSPVPLDAGEYHLAPGGLRSAVTAISGLRQIQRSAVYDELAGAIKTAAEERAAGGGASTPAVPVGEDQVGDLVSELERLNALHRSGALDDAQFEAAKRAVLEREAGR